MGDGRVGNDRRIGHAKVAEKGQEAQGKVVL